MQSIDAGLAKFAEHDVGVRACLAGLDGSDDVTAIIADALRAHEWECVTIGGGVPLDRVTGRRCSAA